MINNITKKFGNQIILKNISISFSGKTALVGLNGVGKTTLINILIGLDKDVLGNVDIIKSASVVFSDNILPDYVTIHELCLSQSLNLIDLDKYLIMFGVEKYKNVLIKNLSLGTQKKMNIIFALLLRKNYLIMDEPTNGLDYQSIYNLAKILKEDTRKIILVSHDFNFIKNVCNNIAILYKQEIIENSSMLELLDKYKKNNLEDIFNYLVEKDVKK